MQSAWERLMAVDWAEIVKMVGMVRVMPEDAPRPLLPITMGIYAFYGF
jgi:hypothetical protein